MKRLISALIALLMVGILPIAANAAYVEEGTAAVAAATAAQSAFDTVMLYQMEGRAGAATATGAKGIALEAILKTKYNVLHLFDSTKAMFSPSSTDPEADLLIVDKVKGLIKKIQCKDGTSTSQISKTLERISNGQYSESELVGTKEFAEAYNAKAANQGIAKMAENSGISTGTTSRIADKAIGSIPTGMELAKSTLKMSGYGAALGGLISTAESVIKGDDLPTAAGNIATDTLVSGLSCAVIPVAQAEFTALLTALGCTAATTAAATTAVGFIVPVAAGAVLCMVVDEADLQERIAECAAELGVKAADLYADVQDYLQQLNCQEKAENIYHNLMETFTESGALIASSFQNAAGFVAEHTESAKTTVSSFFSKIFN